MAAAVPLSFATWQTLLNNFAIESAQFTGAEIGILQSLREVPGFLAFTAVFILIVMREQTLAWVSLAVLGIGTAITGIFPSVVGLYATTVLMSFGYHYLETVHQSLTLQWVEKSRTAEVMGRVISIRSMAGLLVFAGVYLCLDWFDLMYAWVYALGGGLTFLVALLIVVLYPHFPSAVEQRKQIVLRPRYWLYYALVFLSGARRQIFIVFAGFLMVEKFHYSAGSIAILFLINGVISVYIAPKIGRMIARWGERRALTLEYLGLIGVFTTYAFVENHILAASMYVIDHVFFAMAIAIKTYFQKIADPADIASTAGVSFTINHIAAIALPVILGYVWLISPSAVFLTGSVIALMSLILSQLIPHEPQPGVEVTLAGKVVGPRGVTAS
ncbi:MAG: MFS transporter [Pseudomonadota bacterium]